MSPFRAGLAATSLFAVGVAEVVIVVVCGFASDLSWAELNNLLVFSNAVIGLTLCAAGWPIAARRPRNPIGWLLLAGGICYASTGAGIAALACVPAAERADPWWRLAAAVTNTGWTWALTLFLPLSLMLFPRRSAAVEALASAADPAGGGRAGPRCTRDLVGLLPLRRGQRLRGRSGAAVQPAGRGRDHGRRGRDHAVLCRRAGVPAGAVPARHRTGQASAAVGAARPAAGGDHLRPRAPAARQHLPVADHRIDSGGDQGRSAALPAARHPGRVLAFAALPAAHRRCDRGLPDRGRCAGPGRSQPGRSRLVGAGHPAGGGRLQPPAGTGCSDW